MTIKLPDVLVTGFQHSGSSGSDLPSSSGPSGHLFVGHDLGVYDTYGNPSWGLDRIDDRSATAATGHYTQMIWDDTALGGGGTGKATFQDMSCAPAASAQGELQTYMQYELTHTLLSGAIGDDRPQSFSFDLM